MAKKKKSTRKRKNSQPSAPQHTLPNGFWAQVGAVLLFVISFLFVVAWFDVGGPFPEWLDGVASQTVGYAKYVIPLLFIYISVEIFRAENNRLPFVTKLATALVIVWFAGLFGLM